MQSLTKPPPTTLINHCVHQPTCSTSTWNCWRPISKSCSAILRDEIRSLFRSWLDDGHLLILAPAIPCWIWSICHSNWLRIIFPIRCIRSSMSVNYEVVEFNQINSRTSRTRPYSFTQIGTNSILSVPCHHFRPKTKSCEYNSKQSNSSLDHQPQLLLLLLQHCLPVCVMCPSNWNKTNPCQTHRPHYLNKHYKRVSGGGTWMGFGVNDIDEEIRYTLHGVDGV